MQYDIDEDDSDAVCFQPIELVFYLELFEMIDSDDSDEGIKYFLEKLIRDVWFLFNSHVLLLNKVFTNIKTVSLYLMFDLKNERKPFKHSCLFFGFSSSTTSFTVGTQKWVEKESIATIISIIKFDLN